jgi:hypothetical protein
MAIHKAPEDTLNLRSTNLEGSKKNKMDDRKNYPKHSLLATTVSPHSFLEHSCYERSLDGDQLVGLMAGRWQLEVLARSQLEEDDFFLNT